jgi:hypothetical protein
VLAVELDTSLLEPLAGDRIEVRRHDLLAEPLPRDAFDLVQARLLLMHLPSRVEATTSSRPGSSRFKLTTSRVEIRRERSCHSCSPLRFERLRARLLDFGADGSEIEAPPSARGLALGALSLFGWRTRIST